MARIRLPQWLAARQRRPGRGRQEPMLARRLDDPDRRLEYDVVGAGLLQEGDHILCVAGDVIPVNGTVVGATSWTLRHAAAGATVLPDRELGNEQVGAGDIVQSGWLVIRVAERLGMRRAG